MKKLMILGGSRYIIPVIEEAHKLGVYVITCDYLPRNIAHRYSDEYCYASVIDKETVLEVANSKNIDGIISFACDPGVVTAAFVAQEMNLAFQGSYESVCILQDKGLFRQYLINNGFNSPYAQRYTSIDDAINDVEKYKWPIIVKPTDSAGSKGVSKVEKREELRHAIEIAIQKSHNNAFIIEEFLTFKGCHSSTDVFTVDGEVKFITFSDQLFDSNADNPYTPAQIIWPSSMDKQDQDYLVKEIQRLMKLLDMKTGIYNIETCVGNDGKPYIMEVSPRGGGCKIAEIQKMAYGIDLIEAEIRNAIGMSVEKVCQTECNDYWCEMVIHTEKDQSGIFKGIDINEKISKNIMLRELSVKGGDMVYPFTGANMALGDIFFRFDTREELNYVMRNISEFIKIKVENSECVV
ncbi:MAG: ATP-grasp domain-containing protein [Lachnospiraceae bacterium]|nr:ATP-grasp domain-containing protein [Lachnospiraceae bacterium]